MRQLPNGAETVRLSRRSFLVKAGGLGIAVALVGSGGPEPVSAAAAGTLGPINAWITLAADGTVTIVNPAAEMGQGVQTLLPLLLAEELDADWARVRIVQAPSDKDRYGNPAFGGILLTGGSQTTRGYQRKLRLAGAQARKVLLQIAATSLKVPVGELTTSPGVVVHAASGRRLTYGEIAQSGTVPELLPIVEVTDLKPASAWRYLGRNVPRLDVPAKTNGSAVYGIDFHLPDMLHGVVLRPAVQGETPMTVDDAAARAMPGVVEIVKLPYGVGVIARNRWAAAKAREALKVVWSKTAAARTYSSDAILAEYAAIAGDPATKGLDVLRRGDAAKAPAARTIEAVYASDHIHHATMEPPAATARVTGDGIEVWGSVQAPTALQFAAAHVAGVDPDKVVVHTMLLGGGLGRKSEVDFPLDAVLLAKAVPGKPVKVVWSREDDVQHGKYRPVEAQAIRVGLDAGGRVVSWQHRLVCESILARYFPRQFEEMKGVDDPIVDGLNFNYGIPNVTTEYRREPRGVDVGFWRSVGPGYVKFAIEGMVDEVAAATGQDPLAIRLALLQAEPRATAVLKRVAAMAEWQRPRQGTALGLAYSDAFGTHCAQVVEIALNRQTGEIAVKQVWCAVDPGVAFQPDTIVAQMEGGILQGIGQALFEKITFVNGAVQETNFDTYRMIRASEAPPIAVAIVTTPGQEPGGIGEVGVPPVGPAIANAFARLTGGKRLRRYPFLPERVKQALTA